MAQFLFRFEALYIRFQSISGSVNNILLYHQFLMLSQRKVIHIYNTRNKSRLMGSLDMIIKPGHPCVDSSGLCSIDYLSQWRPDMSNLIGLTYALSSIFSHDPPVFAKPPEVY